MIRAVLFDVGGTLHEVRHPPGLAEHYCQTLLDRLTEHGVSLPVSADALASLLHQNAEAYKRWSEEHLTELPCVRIWNEFYLKDFRLGEEILAPLAEEFSWMYDAVRVENVPRPHMRETIRTLHASGLVLGVVSNMISETFVPRLLESYEITRYLSCVVVSSRTGTRKPSPAIFETAARECGVPLAETAYVGDTLSRDVLGCRNAGIPLSIQIQNPAMAFRDAGLAETGLAADAVIRDLSEIPGIIQAYNSKCRP